MVNLNVSRWKEGELHENRMIRSKIINIAYYHPKLPQKGEKKGLPKQKAEDRK